MFFRVHDPDFRLQVSSCIPANLFVSFNCLSVKNTTLASVQLECLNSSPCRLCNSHHATSSPESIEPPVRCVITLARNRAGASCTRRRILSIVWRPLLTGTITNQLSICRPWVPTSFQTIEGEDATAYLSLLTVDVKLSLVMWWFHGVFNACPFASGMRIVSV